MMFLSISLSNYTHKQLLLCDSTVGYLAPTALATLLVNHAALKISFFLSLIFKEMSVCEEENVKVNTRKYHKCSQFCPGSCLEPQAKQWVSKIQKNPLQVQKNVLWVYFVHGSCHGAKNVKFKKCNAETSVLISLAYKLRSLTLTL